ncbi:hypothetical protein BJX99DRAFT_93327 [Aspergillus californicus]
MDPFTHPTQPNMRIPPILVAHQRANSNSNTNTNSTKSTTFTPKSSSTHLATISKRKLKLETSSGSPDLRKCLAHHRLLQRSMQQAREEMKRYLEEVLESDSESDTEDEDEEIVGSVTDMDCFLPMKDRGRGLGQVYGGDIEVEDTVGIRDRFVMTVRRGLARSTRRFSRSRSRSRSPSPSPSRSPSPTRIVSTVPIDIQTIPTHPTSTSRTNPQSNTTLTKTQTAPLRQIMTKNASCSEIPITIHIHEHDEQGTVETLQRSRSLTQYSRAHSIAKYAERLRFRRRCVGVIGDGDVGVGVVPVTT